MVVPWLIPLFAGLGAARLASNFLGMGERRQQLSDRISGLEEQEGLIEPQRQQMEASFQRQGAMLPQQMSARGMYGGSMQTQHTNTLASAHGFAQQRLNTQANAIRRSIDAARRAKKFDFLRDVLGIGGDVAATVGGVADILGQDNAPTTGTDWRGAPPSQAGGPWGGPPRSIWGRNIWGQAG